MLGKFWEVVSGKLADRWAAVAVPALVFGSAGCSPGPLLDQTVPQHQLQQPVPATHQVFRRRSRRPRSRAPSVSVGTCTPGSSPIYSSRASSWGVTVILYAVTNLTTNQASPAHLVDHIRGPRAIGALYHIRGVTYDEEVSRSRLATPRTMASLRNLAISIPRTPRWEQRLEQHRQSLRNARDATGPRDPHITTL